ncbi:DUF2306 domain-containing protein [Paenibacillus sp. J23TS9]|uniref:DUF2306 domain-containing protein n=1 Tax=Paenibacillus sp. J23TS9 TaxID=2807193 RepID=UPI001FD319FF|nr:DUF2306 domain-containing protein [Paenibacillus sp. J23TS9]
MSNTKRFYTLMLAVIFLFILYIAYVQIIYDPQSTVFLGFKTNLLHPLNTNIWLAMMRIHAVFACITLVSGAVNFASTMRRKHRKLHKLNGYTYVAAVMIVGLTSGYMAPYATGGRSVSIAFNVLNMIWPAFTVIALIQIRKNQIHSHRKWMVRSYACCFTNLTVHLLTFFIRNASGWSYPASYRISVYISIPLLLVLAEIVIRTAWKKPEGMDQTMPA